MDHFGETLWTSVTIGIGATLLMDAWVLLRARWLGVPAADYGLVGRWIGWMAHGRFRHERIAAAPRVRGERLIGWTVHYLTGITFAALLLAVAGMEWTIQPRPAPALAVGVATVAAPFLLMQPGMGAGIAARRAPRPWNARMHSVVTHAVFGLGLYLAGLLFSHFS